MRKVVEGTESKDEIYYKSEDIRDGNEILVFKNDQMLT